MRLMVFLFAALVLSGPAAAQAWREYTYPDYAFTVSLPADPQITNTTFQPVDGRTVPARVWTVTRDKNIFKVTIANLANTGLQGKRRHRSCDQDSVAGRRGEGEFSAPYLPGLRTANQHCWPGWKPRDRGSV